MKFRTLPHLLACAAFIAAPTFADEPAPAKPTTPAAAELPGLPWHMVNLWWKGPEIMDFQSFSIDVDISEDVLSEKYNLYISTVYGSLNGFNYYGGIQTNCNGWDAANPASKKRLHGGHGFIFSRWSDKPDLTLDFVRPAKGGFVESAGYEGDFVSGRRPYPWKAGKYTFSLVRMDTQIVDGKPFTWVGCFVKEHATGADLFVNALRFPGDTLKQNGLNAAFIEFYSTSKLHGKPDIASLPPLVIRYSNLRFNGAPADFDHVSVNYIRKQMKRADGLGTPISPNLIRTVASPDGKEITCTLGNRILRDDEEPSRTLFKKPATAR